MNRSYELMVVLDPKADVTEKTAAEVVAKMIGDAVSVTSVSLLGKKLLAYPLKKNNEGIYILAKLKGAPLHVGEIEKKIRMGTDVLRFLLTSVN